MESIAGIDDIATMTAQSEGWCYFVLPKHLSEAFVLESSKILEASKLRSFHGKEFKRGKSAYYASFLKLIKETLTKECDTLLACTILSESWKSEYVGFCERLINRSYSSSNFNLQDLIETSSKLAPPIFTLLRFTGEFSSTRKMALEIDSDALLRKFPEQNISIGPLEIAGSVSIYAAINAYRKKMFPTAPRIPREGFLVKNDEDSLFIQAADIFGNFALSYAFFCLGKRSATNDMKSDIFERTFSELATPELIKDSLIISGEDLVLKNEGAFTVKLTTT